MISGPWRITFDTNPDDCNLNCVMCEEHSKIFQKKKRPVKRRMDFSLIEKTVMEMLPHGLKEIIPSTMGEPLLYRDFDKIIDLVKRKNLKMNLTTNGTFPKKIPEIWARELLPICSDIKISWNGIRPETQESIMDGVKCQKVLDNLRTLLRVREELKFSGVPVSTLTLQITFMKNNFREIPDIIRLASELGIERVKGHHLWVHSPLQNSLSLKNSRIDAGEWNNIVEQCRQTVSENLSVKLENFEKLDIDESNEEINLSGQCPFLGKEAWINTAGDFDVCCAPHAERRKLGFMGNIKEMSLFKLWNSDEYRQLTETYMKNNVCIKCNMRK